MQNRSTRRSKQRSVRPAASWGLVSRSIHPRIPLGAAMAFDRGDSPLRAASLRSPALRCASPRSPERTGCDPTPDTLDCRVVATAPYHLDGTGKSSCRAPARIVDAAHPLMINTVRAVPGAETLNIAAARTTFEKVRISKTTARRAQISNALIIEQLRMAAIFTRSQ